MKPQLLSLGVLFLAFGGTSCVQMTTSSERATPSVVTATPRSRTVYLPPTTPGTRLNTASVLHTVQVRHLFSNPTTPDNFVLQLRGARVTSGRLHLLVLSGRGDTLAHQVLPASALLTEPVSAATPVREQEISLLRGMNGFFAEQNFQQPAFGAAATQPASLNNADWSRVRRNPAAVAFRFPAADGQTSYLVYGPVSGRAVVLEQTLSL